MSVQPVPEVNPRVKLPSSRRSRIYREVARRLRADERLRGAVRTWQLWDGSPQSDDPVSSAMCPCVRLTPFGESAGPRDNISQRGVLRVEVEMWTAGLNVEDIFDLWAAFEDVLFPSDQTAEAAVRSALHALGAERTPVKVGEPANVQGDPGAEVMRAAGSFTINYRIQG